MMDTQCFNTPVDGGATQSEPRGNSHIPDIKAAVEFLHSWMRRTGTGHVTLVSIDPDHGDIQGHCYEDDPGRTTAWFAEEQSAGRNIYFQPNETPAGFDRKPGKADMVAAVCRFADIDPDPDQPYVHERERLRKLADELAKSGNPPTFIIDSGNGIQPLWVVGRERLPGDAIPRIESETKAIECALGAGGTHNVDRLLRVPGTINYPNKAKRERGRTITTARLLHSGPRGYSTAEAGRLPERIATVFTGSDLVRAKPISAGNASAKEADTQALVNDLEAADTGSLPDDLQNRLDNALSSSPNLR